MHAAIEAGGAGRGAARSLRDVGVRKARRRAAVWGYVDAERQQLTQPAQARQEGSQGQGGAF
jgi:hypothetical protein